MALYTTSTVPPLRLLWENGKVTLQGTLPGDVEKILYPEEGETYVFADASRVYNQTKAHYEQRKAEEG